MIQNINASMCHFYSAYFQILLQNCDEKQKQNLLFGYHMMVDEDKMGERFKLFSLFPSVLKEHFVRFPVSGFVDSWKVSWIGFVKLLLKISSLPQNAKTLLHLYLYNPVVVHKLYGTNCETKLNFVDYYIQRNMLEKSLPYSLY